MAALVRSFDWSSTPLGPIHQWPQSLRTAVRILLASRFPMFVWWGEKLINIYNDAYAPILGERHPTALGKPARDIWADVWPVVGPQSQVVLHEGQSTWNEEILLIMSRHGYTEETYFTFSYSPAPNDDGEVGGVFCAVTEDTARVLSHRRVRTLRELGTQLVEAKSAAEVCTITAQVLVNNPHDVPFTLLYLATQDGKRAVLAGHAGIQPGLLASPTEVVLEPALDCQGQWPLRMAPAEGLLLQDLPDRFGDLPGGPWPEPATMAMVIPINQSGQINPVAFLIVGISPRRQFDDDYRGFFGLVTGQIAAAISDAGAYEAQRQRAEALLELDRAKTTFFSNVSHEFRTPLTLMLGPIEDLRVELARSQTPAGNRQFQQLELVHRNSLRLLKLVNSLLDFSRIEAARVQIAFLPTDLAAMTTDLASAFRAAIEKAGMRLVVDCPPLPKPIYVDREMWEKIVLNLLSNAFKFTFQGEIAVSLCWRGDRVELAVRDTGTGIPSEELNRVFDRFHRVPNARSRTHEGTGIGLALVKELVHFHSGSIAVASQVNQGTTFTVSIPTGDAHLPRERISDTGAQLSSSSAIGATPYVEEALRWLPDAPRDSEMVVEPTVAPGRSPLALAQNYGRESARVLLADDNADMRQYLRQLLSQHWSVETVPGGAAALDAATRNPPDLVLADIMMPGLDGFELLHRLRANPDTREIPVILLSARAGEEARVEGMEAGADDYLIKPFSARELVARVRTHLQLARVRRDANRALRESEERFRTMADGLPLIVWVHDAQGRQQFVNRTFCEFFGVGLDEMTGERWQRLTHPEDTEAYAAEFFACVRERRPFHAQVRVRRADGQWRWIESWARPRVSAMGDFMGFVGASADITERKQAEAALQDAQAKLRQYAEDLESTVQERTARLQETIQELEQYSYSISHDMRAPLRAMSQYAQWVWEDYGEKLDAEGQAYLKRIAAAATRLDSLINDVLTYHRMVRSDMTLEPVDLDALARDIIQQYPMIQASQAEIEVGDHLLPVRANLAALTQCLSNLLGNAVKFVAPGVKPKVWIWTELRDSWVRVWVEDNGIGIDSSHLHRIWGIFHQVHGNKVYEGTGIGLSIVKKAVERMGGRVGVESQLGKGSRFWFELQPPIK